MITFSKGTNLLQRKKMEDFTEWKKLVLDLKDKVYMFEFLLPKHISLVDVANELNLSRQTLRAHVYSNYRVEVDFYKKNNKIMLDVSILLSIRRRYAK